MRIFILALGTRGDLELFLTLARQLRGRGHQVVVGTSAFHVARVQQAGVEWAAVGPGTLDELLAILRSLAAIPDRTERTYAYYRRWLRPQLSAATEQITALGGASDYFISNLKMILRRGDRAIPGATVTYDPPGQVAELARYGSQEQGGRILDLVAMNKQLVDPENRWGEPFRFTGFWMDDSSLADWTPPAELVEFLDGGPPPVVVTLGSMVMFDSERLVHDVARALDLAGQRGIIVSGWSGITAGAGPAVCVSEAPYAWLFPRASCIVHHGGCGTVAAALRAGRPSILLPQILAQEHFARRLTEEGLATGCFDVDGLKPDALADAVRRAVGDERVRQIARAWQATIAADAGVPAAVEAIEAHWAGVGGA
jgi:UDP:flavonoid glycosyltransferase YjiC (YdhE family)